MKFRFAELYKNTWQGEGPDSGRLLTLIRFKRCNRIDSGNTCEWCDTAVKLRITAEAEYNKKNIWDYVNSTSGMLITGGEPTYEDNLETTCNLLTICSYDICNIETNGYNLKDLILKIDNTYKLKTAAKKESIKIIYSPKMFNDKECEAEIEKILTYIDYPALFLKFVDDQSPYLLKCLDKIFPHVKRKNQLWIMPQGTSYKNLIANSCTTFDLCEKYNLNFSSRNHIIYNFI